MYQLDPTTPASAAEPADVPECLRNPEDDVPLRLAAAAHAGTSFVPDERARQERADHARTLRADYAALAQHATTPEARALLDAEFARYRQGLAKRKLAHIAARARVLSPMIAGPSNFPVARNEKANRAADARWEDYAAFRTRALDAIQKTLRPDLRPIMAGDEDAPDRLRAKLAELKESQATMVAVNAAIRKHWKTGKDATLQSIQDLGLTEAQARKAITPDVMGGIGFPSYALHNNGANVRRVEARLAAVERGRATPAASAEGAHARLEDAPADNRVRLIFPGKPDAATRDGLKAAGFRWAPTLGAWQAYRNPGTLATARRVAGVPDAPPPAPAAPAGAPTPTPASGKALEAVREAAAEEVAVLRGGGPADPRWEKANAKTRDALVRADRAGASDRDKEEALRAFREHEAGAAQ